LKSISKQFYFYTNFSKTGARMDQKLKKRLLTIGSVFVAIIFLTSYASYANNNTGQTTSTTTIGNVQTYFVSGTANAIVSNYSSSLNIILINASQNSSTYDMISSVLGNLQLNGSVLNYFYNIGRYQVYLGSGIDAYGMQSLLNKTVSNKNFKVEATSYVTLPSTLRLFYQDTAVDIFIGGKQYPVTIVPPRPINSTVKVTVQALVTANGIPYQNNIRINYTG